MKTTGYHVIVVNIFLRKFMRFLKISFIRKRQKFLVIRSRAKGYDFTGENAFAQVNDILGTFIHEIKTKGYDVIDINIFLNKLMTREKVMMSLVLLISTEVKNMGLLALMFFSAR